MWEKQLARMGSQQNFWEWLPLLYHLALLHCSTVVFHKGASQQSGRRQTWHQCHSLETSIQWTTVAQFQLSQFWQKYSSLLSTTLLKEEQAGFRPNRSTQDILLRTIDDWKAALDGGHIIATVMIDLNKAFDTISHGLLLKKLGYLVMSCPGLLTTSQEESKGWC